MEATSSAGIRSARHLRIYGTVQGVGYRFAFEREARALRLSGWVRNRLDGTVEAMVAGEPQALDRIIAWAWRGPAAAHVEQVIVSEADGAAIAADRFERLPTV